MKKKSVTKKKNFVRKKKREREEKRDKLQFYLYNAHTHTQISFGFALVNVLFSRESHHDKRQKKRKNMSKYDERKKHK